MWKTFLNGMGKPTMDHLKALQALIEQPVITPLLNDKGKHTKQTLTILGFNCQYEMDVDKKRSISEADVNGKKTKKLRSDPDHAAKHPIYRDWAVVNDNPQMEKENTPIMYNRTHV